jgi:hypothetical protein
MHHYIILKVWAGSADEAKDIATSELESSIEPENNEAGWDYVGEVAVITEKDLASYGVTSYKELEKKKIEQRKESMNDLIEEFKDEITVLLAPLCLTKDEAPLLINTENDNLKEYIEKLLKRKIDNPKPPSTFEGILNLVMKIMVHTAQDDANHSMILWRMKHISKLQHCMTYSDPCHTLQCTDNYYAEIPCNDNKKELKPFFIVGDRHF